MRVKNAEMPLRKLSPVLELDSLQMTFKLGQCQCLQEPLIRLLQLTVLFKYAMKDERYTHYNQPAVYLEYLCGCIQVYIICKNLQMKVYFDTY